MLWIEKLLKNPYGAMALSSMLGFGLAAMFYKACDDHSCTAYVSPAQRDVLLKQHRFGESCYEYEKVDVACDDPSKVFHVSSRK